jgi:hypothetical protein
MTSNKEKAYYAAVERAFRGDASKTNQYKSVAYEPLDPQFQKGAAEVLAALNDLADSETVNKKTFAFMLAIGPSAIGKYKTLKGPVLWTVKQVKAFRVKRAKKEEDIKNDRSSKAVARQDTKKREAAKREQVLADLPEQVAQLSNSDATPDMRDVVKVLANVIVVLGGRILCFVDLHSLTREELTSAFRAGARIERMTLREALIVRVWVNPAERMPWIAGYRALFNRAADHERELIAEREAEHLKDVLAVHGVRGLPSKAAG